MTDISGFSLFDDIEDEELRTRNRVVVLANMIEMGTNKSTGLISDRILQTLKIYFENIPQQEREKVFMGFVKEAYRRGYKFNVNGQSA